MLRADLHHHIDTDPVDGHFVPHTGGALVDRAAAVGLQVVAITCHESRPFDDDLVRYGARRGVRVLPGMEATVDGQHVLLVNFRDWPPGRCTLDDIAARKTPEALVIAPHPFYPAGIAGERILRDRPELFDAVEFSGMYTALTRRFNARALAYAAATGLPVVGNSDTHFLWQMGRTWTEIEAPPDAAAIVAAIRRGRVRLVTRPLGWQDVVRFVVASRSAHTTLRDGLRYLARLAGQRRGTAARPRAGVLPA